MLVELCQGFLVVKYQTLCLLVLSSLSGGLFSWLDERHSVSREAINNKKAQWKRELGTYSERGKTRLDHCPPTHPSYVYTHTYIRIYIYIGNKDSNTGLIT